MIKQKKRPYRKKTVEEIKDGTTLNTGYKPCSEVAEKLIEEREETKSTYSHIIDKRLKKSYKI